MLRLGGLVETSDDIGGGEGGESQSSRYCSDDEPLAQSAEHTHEI